MKRKGLFIATVLFAITCLFGLSACGEIENSGNFGNSGDIESSDSESNSSGIMFEHKHDYVLVHDDHEHWYECKEPDCPEKIKDRAGHIYDKDGNCICGARQPVIEHKHNYIMQSDENEHWQECTEANCPELIIKREKHHYNFDGYCECGKQQPVIEHIHNYIWVSETEEHWQECTEADCPDKMINFGPHSYDADGKCVCGRQQSPTVHNHNYIYASDENEHWLECTEVGCPEKIIDRSPHNYDVDGKCICGRKESVVEHNHNYIYVNDENEHWQECTEANCPEKIINREKHSYDINGFCICGKQSGGTTSVGNFEFVLSDDGKSYILQRYQGGTNQVVIPETYNGLDVESIGDSAFSGWTGITSVFISEKIKRIGTSAFESCYSLERIILPDGVVSVGERAFVQCENLKEIVIGKGLESLGQEVFYACEKLENIEVDSDNRYFSTQNGVLYNKEKTEFIHIPYSVTEITIPSGIVKIEDNMFNYRRNLTKVVMSENIESIGTSAFYGCEGLETVVVPNSTASIGYNAFGECSRLKSLTLPNSNNFGYIFGSNQYWNNAQYVPLSLKEVIITGGTIIDDRTFYGCSGIEKITLPKNMTKLGRAAFYGCNSLIDFIVPEGVTYLNDELFYDCRNLKTVLLPDSLEIIWDNVFYGCDSLTYNRYENGCYLGTESNSFVAFIKPFSTDITSYSINSQAKIIAGAAFENCNALREITIPDSVTNCWSSAFSGCDNIVSAAGPLDILASYIPKTALQTLTITSGEYINSYMFREYEQLETLTLPASINRIDAEAFHNCNNIKRINIADLESWCKITRFGVLPGENHLYLNDRELTDLEIPDTVENINGWTFYGCRSIETLVIPNSVTSIGRYAFQHCDNLKTVIISDGTIKHIGEQAFAFCGNLEEITIPNSVETMDRGVFRGSNHLKQVTLPFVGNTKDGTGNAFFAYMFGADSYSYNYESVIPATLKTVVLTSGSRIPDYAFYDCHNIENIVIPDSVTSIGTSAFSSCGLKTIEIPKSVTFIGEDALNCAWLESVIVEEENTAYFSQDGILYNKAQTEVVHIPFNVKGTITIPGGMKSIPDDSFRCSYITGLIIPDSVTRIGSRAFDCPNLESLVLPDGLAAENVVTNKFSNCSKLTSATLPMSLLPKIYKSELQAVKITSGETVPNSAFSHCSDLKSVILPDDITSIGANAFEYCSSLTDFEMPETVTSIGEYAFYYCMKLPEVTIPEGIITIGTETFSYCTAFTNIEIPSSVREIGQKAFMRCGKLTSIEIPDGVERIGASAFYGCTGANSVVIPNSVKSVGDKAFEECSLLENVTIGENVSEIGAGVFSLCTDIKHITMPANWLPQIRKYSLCSVVVTGGESIAENAFNGSANLTSVTIPAGLKSIGAKAFFGCNNLSEVHIADAVSWSQITFGDVYANPIYYTQKLYRNGNLMTELEIPSGISEISSYAFYNCRGLESITISDSVTRIGTDAFANCINISAATIPSSLVQFISKDNLQQLTVTSGEISDVGMFSGCTRLKSVTISDRVNRIEPSVFEIFDNLESITVDENSAEYFGKDGILYNKAGTEFLLIPKALSGEVTISEGITSIADSAFSARKNLSGIVISENVKTIGASAFSDCVALKNVTIPDGITSIGEDAFKNCEQITTVSLPAEAIAYIPKMNLQSAAITSGEAIASEAFKDCANLQSVTMWISIKSIGASAFSGCTNLESVKISDYVTSIGRSAFYHCNKLPSIRLPFVGNTKEGTENTHFGYIFGAPNYSSNGQYMPTALKTVEIAGGTKIDSYAFFSCPRLEEISIAGSIESISLTAFDSCANLKKLIISDTNAYYSGNGEVLYNKDKTEIVLALRNIAGDRLIPDTVTSIGNRAFDSCKNLTSVVMSDSVKSIGISAFEGCIGLTDVTLSANLTDIGNSAFAGCKKLQDVTIPEGVQTIGRAAFRECTRFSRMSVPDSVTSLGESSFQGCSQLVSISLPEHLTALNASTFAECAALSELTIPSTVTVIGAYSFRGCKLLESIVVPSGVTSIGVSVFENCGGLTSVEIPNGVESIGRSAFYGCEKLTEILLPDNLKSISASAFENCVRLGTIALPENLYMLDVSAFNGCSGLESITVDAYNSKFSDQEGILYNKSKTQIIYVPKAIKGNITLSTALESIGDSNFSDCGNLTGITIFENVTSIGRSAFENCTQLTSLLIPDNVESIGYKAFYGCNGLTEITLPFVGASKEETENTDFEYVFREVSGRENSLKTVIITGGTKIGDFAFRNCDYLERIELPDSVTSIGICAFENCIHLKSFIIPRGLKMLANSLFFNCESLSNIEIPENIVGIGNNVFYHCKSLTRIFIPNTVKTLGSGVFSECSGATEIVIPDVFLSIGNAWFSGCSNLTRFEISEKVTSIGDSAFWGCSSLAEIIIPESVTSIGNSAFRACRELTNIDIPMQVMNIGKFAFMDCTALTEITLPFVGESAAGTENTHFGYIFGANKYTDNSDNVPSSLKKVVIKGGTKIDNFAFDQCVGLETIALPNTLTSIGQSFSGCDSLMYLTVDSGNPVYRSSGNCIIDTQNKAVIAGCKNSVIPVDKNVTSIDSYAFSSCVGLESIVIPDNITNFGEGVFRGCSGLKNITLSKNLEYISSYTFYNCSSLSEIRIPEGVRSLGGNTFENCTGLKTVVIPNSVTGGLGSTFSNCNEIVSYTGPAEAFLILTSKLQTAEITSGTLRSYMFVNCKELTSVTISTDVVKFEEYIFKDCAKLENIYYKGTKAQWNSIDKMFTWDDEMVTSCVIHCTDGNLRVNVS